MHDRIRIARGTKSQREVSTLTPAEGQPVFETDTRKLYIGEKDGDGNLKELKDLDAINAASADNVTSKINGQNIDDIFYSGGKIVKYPLRYRDASTSPVTYTGEQLLDSDDYIIILDDTDHYTQYRLDKIKRLISSPITLNSSNNYTDNSVYLDYGDEIIEIQLIDDQDVQYNGGQTAQTGRRTYNFVFDAGQSQAFFPINTFKYDFGSVTPNCVISSTLLKVSKISGSGGSRSSLKFELGNPSSVGVSGVDVSNPTLNLILSPLNTSDQTCKIRYNNNAGGSFTIKNIWSYRRFKASN